MSDTISPVVGKTYKTRSGDIVGPMEEPSEGDWSKRVGVTFEGRGWFKDGTYSGKPHLLDIVSEFKEGPVRNVTRLEPVEGKHGIVQLDVHNGQIVVTISPEDGHQPSGDELRSAAMILSQIAEYRDEVAK